MLVDALKLAVMPPLSLFLAIGIGFLLWRRRPRLARVLVAGGLSLLVLLSIPMVAIALEVSLQGTPPAGPLEAGDAQAIVVLGADGNPFAPEYGGPTVGALTLERLRHAAQLAKASGLPVLTSGGVLRRGEPPLADAMAAVLEGEFGVTVRWRETRSADTRENARFSAELLREAGFERVLVVTHAWHLPRALAAFRDAGLDPRPAGTLWRRFPGMEVRAWLPSARALRESSWAVHEWIGRAWYALS